MAIPKLRALLLAVAGVGALRSAPSRFANRGSAASARKRILPVLRPEGDAPALLPVPGLKRRPVWNSNLQPDFNVSVFESFDASSLALLRELDESNRFVQKSAESTSI